MGLLPHKQQSAKHLANVGVLDETTGNMTAAPSGEWKATIAVEFRSS